MAASKLAHWLTPAIDVAFPPHCAWCDAELARGVAPLLCGDCQSRFSTAETCCSRCASPLPPPSSAMPCPQCAHHRFHFAAATRLGAYEGPLRAAVLRMKDAKSRGLSLALGDLLALRCGEPLHDWQVDAVVPVPMHWSRRLWRGTNCPTTIAARVAALLDVPLADHLLVRRRRTVPQASLSPRRRRANVRGAFAAAAHRDLPGARLLLIDDIMTTGATLDEAAKVLLQCGASFVAVAVIARASGDA